MTVCDLEETIGRKDYSLFGMHVIVILCTHRYQARYEVYVMYGIDSTLVDNATRIIYLRLYRSFILIFVAVILQFIHVYNCNRSGLKP